MEATLSINGLWSVLKKIGVTLSPIEKEEVKAGILMPGSESVGNFNLCFQILLDSTFLFVADIFRRKCPGSHLRSR